MNIKKETVQPWENVVESNEEDLLQVNLRDLSISEIHRVEVEEHASVEWHGIRKLSHLQAELLMKVSTLGADQAPLSSDTYLQAVNRLVSKRFQQVGDVTGVDLTVPLDQDPGVFVVVRLDGEGTVEVLVDRATEVIDVILAPLASLEEIVNSTIEQF